MWREKNQLNQLMCRQHWLSGKNKRISCISHRIAPTKRIVALRAFRLESSSLLFEKASKMQLPLSQQKLLNTCNRQFCLVLIQSEIKWQCCVFFLLLWSKCNERQTWNITLQQLRLGQKWIKNSCSIHRISLTACYCTLSANIACSVGVQIYFKLEAPGLDKTQLIIRGKLPLYFLVISNFPFTINK